MERKNKYSPSNTYYKITSTNLQLKAENSIISSGFKKFEKHWKDSWTSWLQFVAIMTPCWVKHEHWPSLARSRTEEYYNIIIFPQYFLYDPEGPHHLLIFSYYFEQFHQTRDLRPKLVHFDQFQRQSELCRKA